MTNEKTTGEENFTTLSGCSQFELAVVVDTITISREKLKRLVEIARQGNNALYSGGWMEPDKHAEQDNFIRQFKKEIGE